MSININFEKAAEADKPIDTGPYPVIVKSFKIIPETAEEQENRLKNEDKYPYFNVSGEITEGPEAGKRIYTNLTCDPRPSEKNPQVAKNFMLYNFAKALGLANNETKDISIDPNEIINKSMTWLVDYDKQDSSKNAVVGFKAASTE